MKHINLDPYPKLFGVRFEIRMFFFLFKTKISNHFKSRNETFMIFSGGMPAQTDVQQASPTNATPPKPSPYFLTIVRGQTTNVLHMDNAIIDFHVITPSPHIAGIFNCFVYSGRLNLF